MRYWLFDGNDVVGPFTPQELSAMTEFSAASMVCPESESENQQAWKMASSFPDFQFNEQTGEVIAKEDGTVSQPVSQKPAVSQQPATSPVQPVIPVKPAPVESIALASPITLATETEEIIALPGKPDTPEEPVSAEEKTEAQTLSVSEETPAKESVESQKTAPEPEPESKPEPEPESEPENISTCTLPMAASKEEFTKSNLPRVEESDNPRRVEIEYDPFVAADASLEKDTKEETVKESNAVVPPAVEEIRTPKQNPEDTISRAIRAREVIKPKLESTPEIDAFLHKQQEGQRPNRQKARLMLWLLLVLLLPGIIALAVYISPKQQNPVSKIEKEESAKHPEKVSNVAAAPTETPAPVEKTKPVSKPQPPVSNPLIDQAIAAVQNHQLTGKRGTIASYFDRLYHTQLASGYTGEWSAEPLHKSVYIVKYRLTKTRTEPIVYVFQADTSKGKLTGALNNVALDLVGKI